MLSLKIFPNTSPRPDFASNHDGKTISSSSASEKNSASDSDTDLESSVLSVENLLPEKRESESEREIDGGKHGWICVLGGWFALFCTFGLLNS